MRITNEKKSYAYYIGYILCVNMISWASSEYALAKENNDIERKNKIKLFLPTTEVYGVNEYSENYLLSKYNFDRKNTGKEHEYNEYKQPKNIYDKDLEFKRLSKKYYEFNITKSKLYDISGLICENYFSS